MTIKTVICPEGVIVGYLTPGKTYHVIRQQDDKLILAADDGARIASLIKGSAHLEDAKGDFLDWILP